MRLLPLFLLALAARAEFLAGAAKAVITPDLKTYGPVYMAGFDHGRAATGVHDDLWARCVAMKAGARPTVICEVDLIGLFYDDTQRVRAEIRKKHPNADVVVASTHVHEGPDTMGQWGANRLTPGINDAYMAFLTGRIAEAGVAALDALRPAHATLAAVAPPELDDFIADDRPPIRHDAGLVVLALSDAAGKPIATVVNWANHPETLGSRNTELTSDYPHYLRTRLEARVGGVGVLWNGAVGGMQSPLGAKVKDPASGAEAKDRTFRKAEISGQRVADLAAEALASAKPSPVESLVFRETVVRIPMTNPGFQMAAKAGLFKGRKLPNDDGTTNTPVGLVRIAGGGQALVDIALIPGEMYPELSLGGVERYSGADYPDAPIEPAIKTLETAKFRMLIGLANDEIGYIIPKAEWDEKPPFLNNSPRRHYGEVNSVGPDAAPRIAEAFQRLAQP